MEYGRRSGLSSKRLMDSDHGAAPQLSPAKYEYLHEYIGCRCAMVGWRCEDGQDA